MTRRRTACCATCGRRSARGCGLCRCKWCAGCLWRFAAQRDDAAGAAQVPFTEDSRFRWFAREFVEGRVCRGVRNLPRPSIVAKVFTTQVGARAIMHAVCVMIAAVVLRRRSPCKRSRILWHCCRKQHRPSTRLRCCDSAGHTNPTTCGAYVTARACPRGP